MVAGAKVVAEGAAVVGAEVALEPERLRYRLPRRRHCCRRRRSLLQPARMPPSSGAQSPACAACSVGSVRACGIGRGPETLSSPVVAECQLAAAEYITSARRLGAQAKSGSAGSGQKDAERLFAQSVWVVLADSRAPRLPRTIRGFGANFWAGSDKSVENQGFRVGLA